MNLTEKQIKRREYYQANKERELSSGKAWKAKNSKATKRNWLVWKYGITEDQYNSMLVEQEGVCIICGQKETKKSRTGNIVALHVDHDHSTGKVRGLLCHKCNTILGLGNENKEVFYKIIQYLDEAK